MQPFEREMKWMEGLTLAYCLVTDRARYVPHRSSFGRVAQPQWEEYLDGRGISCFEQLGAWASRWEHKQILKKTMGNNVGLTYPFRPAITSKALSITCRIDP